MLNVETVAIGPKQVTISVSPVTKAVLDTMRMHYARPGVPAPDLLNLSLVFGSLSGVLCEIATAIQQADPIGFRREQPPMVHAAAQLTFVLSSSNPQMLANIMLATGLAIDGAKFEPPAAAVNG